MTMSASSSKGNGDFPQHTRIPQGSTDSPKPGRTPQRQGYSRNMPDPDGAYFDSPQMVSRFDEKVSCDQGFIDGYSYLSVTLGVDDTDSTLLTAGRANVRSHTIEPVSRANAIGSIDFGSSPSTDIQDEEAYIDTKPRLSDALHKEQSPFASYHATSYHRGITDRTAELFHSCVENPRHQYSSYYDDVHVVTNENNGSTMEHVSDRVHRYNRLHTPSCGRTEDTLSEYDLRIERKCNSATACTQVSRKTISIGPGQHVLFRGAAETWKAIQDDFYLPCSCIGCSLMLFCIQDASYVICPKCFDVTPLTYLDVSDGGVGLGFTLEELSDCQKEIIKRYGKSIC